MYLDAEIRAGMSPFGLADPLVVRDGVMALERDLRSDTWHTNYGGILEQDAFDAGYRLVIAAHEVELA